MAAKKKSDSSNQGNKPKNSGNKSPRAKKSTPKPKNEDQPKDPQVSDDDFGLDDIELEPVSDSPEEKSSPEPVSDPIEEIETDSEKAEPKEEEQPEEKEEPIPVVVAASEDHAMEEVKKEEQPKKPEEKKDNSGIIILIIVLLCIIAAVLYFFVFKDKKPEPVQPKIEQTQPIQQQPEPVPEPVKPKAELFTISAPEGRFYVVIGSFYDEDLAEDKAKSIVESGTSAYLLKPTGAFKFHRVGIALSGSMAEGERKRSELVATYGENIWVLKY